MHEVEPVEKADDTKTDSSEKYRFIAQVLREQIGAMVGSDNTTHARKSFLQAQLDSLEERISSNEMASQDSEDGVVYEVESWDPLTFRPSKKQVMTTEELADWVDSTLIDDPALDIRLGFTDDLSPKEKALTIILDRMQQPQ